MKWSESLSNGVSIITGRCIEHMELAVYSYMAVSFITFFHILLVPFFLPLCIWLHVLYASV